jgi:predicted secreted hydrolase
MAPSGQYLVAKTDRFSFDLMCRPQKTPVAHGVSGYSQKGVKPESASCYYSSTRLRTSGTLSVDGRTFTVQGTAWMDHEYSTAPLEPSLVGWDWFSLQFTDNTELMLYILRAKDGAWSPSSSGTFVHSSGAARHLSRDDFQVDILERWRSPHSGTRYPARWRIRVLPLNVDVELFPSLPDQELRLTHSMNVSYWEGSVKIKGSKAHRAAEGVGYVEMTGYAKPFDLLNQRIMRPVNDNKDK